MDFIPLTISPGVIDSKLTISLQIREHLHYLIHNSDLVKLKNYVDSLQSSLLSFNDPSLLMLAIEIYLDPKKINNQEFQYEIIIFLTRCGLSFYLPTGNMFYRLYEYCQQKIDENSELEKQRTEEEIEQKLIMLFDQLLGFHHRTEILNYQIPINSNFKILTTYLQRQQAAKRIQNFWRSYQKQRNKVILSTS